ncbi:MAG TPA: glycosyltransferase family 4 protein [Pseudosphingobacterium sp.]|nr:glycosyltransferase family 4 protein [Pseudosphingobacterium sp.]
MKIIFEPISSDENQYVRIFVDIIKKNNLQAYSLNYALMRPWLLARIKVVHLNWFDNIDGKNNMEVFVNFVKRLIQLSILKLFRKKIIWTMHNRFPHQPEGKFFKKRLLSHLIKKSSHIVIHSKYSKSLLLESYSIDSNKIYYIPHPNYIGEYETNIVPNIAEEDKGKELRLLFIGAVKPYKNVELLIDVVSALKGCKIQLTLAGKAKDSEYEQYITAYASKLSSVVLELDFIPDHAIVGLIKQADLVVLPYDLKSSLNSGTVILAFSCARTVVCPVIGTIDDLPEKDKVITYHYKVDNDKDHLRQLNNAISKAYKLFQADEMIFKKWGEDMFKQVQKHNSKELCAEMLMTLYKQYL